jgi:hypothetical protein
VTPGSSDVDQERLELADRRFHRRTVVSQR